MIPIKSICIVVEYGPADRVTDTESATINAQDSGAEQTTLFVKREMSRILSKIEELKDGWMRQ